MVRVADRSALTLKAALEKHIAPCTTIVSDCWKGYPRLSEWGYTHLSVNHSRNFADAATGTHTQSIERQWRSLKESKIENVTALIATPLTLI